MDVLFSEYEIKIGLKLWSTNVNLIAQAKSFYDENLFQYIELYAVPGTYDETIKQWKSCPVPYAIHCSHSAHGFNLANKQSREKNKEIFSDVKMFADALNSKAIIVHGGNDGNIDETIMQIQDIWDERILIENKPKIGLNHCLCIGWNPQEIQKIKESGKLSGFVLDFAHAFCAANASGEDQDEFIDGFLPEKPRMFHLSDGDKYSDKDKHMNFGEGNFDIKKLVFKVPAGSSMTIETPMGEGGLDYFKKDISYLNELLKK